MLFCATAVAQNVTANQNQQIINVNVPTIEKKVYVEKYRTVYVEKPRVARKLDAPVKLLGFLWVYPEDIGNFNNVPVDVLLNINSTKPYGRSDWRMPTPDELSILENNADAIGLGDGIYLATDHRNGILRLVATENVDYSKCARIGDTYWSKCNFGTIQENNAGRPLTYQEAIDKAPAGYRLPTEDEALNLIYSGEAWFGNEQYYFSSVNGTIRFPYTETLTNRDGDKTGERGKYWVQGNKCITFEYRWGLYANQWGIPTERRLNKEAPQIEECGGTAHVKYVLDK